MHKGHPRPSWTLVTQSVITGIGGLPTFKHLDFCPINILIFAFCMEVHTLGVKVHISTPSITHFTFNFEEKESKSAPLKSYIIHSLVYPGNSTHLMVFLETWKMYMFNNVHIMSKASFKLLGLMN